MRKLYLLFMLFVSICSGCASTPRPYDGVEYQLSVLVTVDATRAVHQCVDSTPTNAQLWLYIHLVNTNSMIMEEFLYNKGNSQPYMASIDQIRQMVGALEIRGKFSAAYCVNKLTNIQAGSRILSRALGQTDKVNMCEGGIKSRVDIFTRDYNAKKISAGEYKELVSDGIKLQTIDTAGCDTTTKQKMLEELQLIEQMLPSIMKL